MNAPIYTRYTVMGYNSANDDLSTIRDSALIEVFAENETQAIEKAQKLITKNHYRVSRVEEYFYDQRIEGKTGKDE